MTARPHKAAEVRRRRKANPLAIRAHLAPSTAVLRCNSSVSGAFKGGFFASSRYEISLPARFRCLNALKEPPLDPEARNFWLQKRQRDGCSSKSL